MTELQLTIPAQDRDSGGVRLKPREVREWLQNLPYMDALRTLQLANQQLRLLNRQVIAPGARLEILDEFLRTYQRLSETAPGDPADAAALQPLLKQLSQNIGFGYKILVHVLANGKAGFFDARHLPAAMLGAVHALGQQLVHCYMHYKRVPRALWGECLTVFRHAQSSNRSGYTARLGGNEPIAIDASFRLIALLKLTDPYQLRPGMMAALQHYFRSHIDLTHMSSLDHDPDAAILMVPAGDQRLHSSESDGIAIDITALLKQIRNDILRLEKQQDQTRIGGMAAGVPGALLLATLKKILGYWEERRERTTSREDAAIGIELVVGLEAAYCAINGNRPFDAKLYLTGDEDNHINIGAPAAPGATPRNPPAAKFQCVTTNRNSGGLGICYRGTSPSPRVGQLLAARRAPPTPGNWVLGVFRWLAESESMNGFDAGLQYLAGEPVAAVIRPSATNETAGEFQPAITADQKRGEQSVRTIIACVNQLHTGAAFALYDNRGVQHRARCIELLESGSGFDRFIYQLLS